MRTTTSICALVVTLLAAGCGGGSRTAATPRLPGPLANRLAAQTDGVATALADGNACAARARGRALQIRTIREINARHVPQAYEDQLMSAVNELMRQLPACVTTTPAAPAPAPTPASTPKKTKSDEHGKKGKHKGHGGKHGGGKGEGD
ncbi:MAG: hypothetical protein QOE36_2490 [Gaiellaceae bacterium]|jgi:hypothetical protein|nr:hypothetical protein [Gaiellaceae bacterium]